MNKVIFFKRDFDDYLICPKKLWINKNDAQQEQTYYLDPYLEFVGNSIGTAAQKWSENTFNQANPGKLIERNEHESALGLTKEALQNKEPLLFEASFTSNAIYSKVDLLYKYGSDNFQLGEVKSTVSIGNEKDAIKRYGDDLSIQYVALEEARKNQEIEIEKYNLITPCKDKSGIGIDGIQFKSFDLTEYVKNKEYQIKKQRDLMLDVVHGSQPEIKIDRMCKASQCPYLQRCSNTNEMIALDLPAQGGSKEKFDEIRDLPMSLGTPIKDIDYQTLKKPHSEWEQIFQAVNHNQSFVDKEKVKGFFDTYTGPFGYIDFEYVSSSPINLGNNLNMGDRVLFQYVLLSRNTIDDSCSVSHFLDLDSENPNLKFLQQILKDTKELNSIFVYNLSAEGGSIKKLQKDYPDYADDLQVLYDKFVDLYPLVRSAYYAPSMNGSFSLKAVLPSIGKSYEDSNIQGGSQAQLEYLMYRLGVNHNKAQLDADLKMYCQLDTEGLVHLHDYLLKAITA